MRSAALLVACALPLAVAWPAGRAQAAPDALTEAYQTQQQRCEAARTARLQPLRVARIEQCVRAGRERSDCETFFSTYGNNTNHANGSTVRGRFYDLPECRAAEKALRAMNSKQNF